MYYSSTQLSDESVFTTIENLVQGLPYLTHPLDLFLVK